MIWNHLFIIDPIENLHPQLDSSLRMMFALWERKHKIYICTNQELYLETQEKKDLKQQTVFRRALCSELSFKNGSNYEMPLISIQESRSHDLEFFHGIHMRKDPPFDMNYVASTWLLDNLSKKTKIYNRPDALRNANEKLLITFFPDSIAPLLVTSKPHKIFEFIRSQKEVVLKPLDLFGGRGVIRIASQDYDDHSLLQLLQNTMRDEQGQTSLRLVQPFNKSIAEGEIRVFTAFGEPLAWCLKKPQHGEFLANTRAGATLHPMTPTQQLLERVTNIAQKLQESGIQLVGFDIIGDLVSEINITSPRMLIAPGDSRDKPFQRFAELCELDLKNSLDYRP